MLTETENKIDEKIEDKKYYKCNSEIYEELVLKFCIEYKTCAVCRNLSELKKHDSVCRQCGQGSNFDLEEFEEVRNEQKNEQL